MPAAVSVVPSAPPPSSADEVDDEVVEVGEEFVGGQVDVGEGAYGGAQPAHGGGGVDAVADDVADDEGDPGAGQRDDVEPVAAHAGLAAGGQVAGGDLECRLVGQRLREQAALQGHGGGAFAGVAAGVVDGDGGPGGEFLGEPQVVLLEGFGAVAAGEEGDAEGGAVGAHRHDHQGVGSRLAGPGGCGVVGCPAGECGVVCCVQGAVALGQAAGHR